jgi:hypothetical protein
MNAMTAIMISLLLNNGFMMAAIETKMAIMNAKIRGIVAKMAIVNAMKAIVV